MVDYSYKRGEIDKNLQKYYDASLVRKNGVNYIKFDNGKKVVVSVVGKVKLSENELDSLIDGVYGYNKRVLKNKSESRGDIGEKLTRPVSSSVKDLEWRFVLVLVAVSVVSVLVVSAGSSIFTGFAVSNILGEDGVGWKVVVSLLLVAAAFSFKIFHKK